METRPWKRARIIELPRSRRETKPLLVPSHGAYCGACGTACSSNDVFCGMCGVPLNEQCFDTPIPVSFGLTAVSWRTR